jgi:hypothetical protein
LNRKNLAFEKFYNAEYATDPRSINEILSMDNKCCYLCCNWNFSPLEIMIAREFLPVREHGMGVIKEFVGAMVMQMPGEELVIGRHLVCGDLFSWIYFVPKQW